MGRLTGTMRTNVVPGGRCIGPLLHHWCKHHSTTKPKFRCVEELSALSEFSTVVSYVHGGVEYDVVGRIPCSCTVGCEASDQQRRVQKEAVRGSRR